ncbi:E3 ubiquitin-protein ligase RBBP6-like isoform X4 [Bacillus rossius redtenbacheri]|uniref:E3 ubiquitin-protein ligase RBBP6-like isoform X4 n=1 Tax=Bacillus rossius redtenbacheri TaxID=93214 RepID=UPI002FDD986E
MSVHYKFKSTLEYDTVTFDGLHISVRELKKAILYQKRIGKNTDFDLQVTNAQTKEVYTDDNTLIPKNTSLIVARIPLTAQQKKAWDRSEANQQLAGVQKNIEVLDSSESGVLRLAKAVDLTSLDASEEDKIQAMMTQSTQDYSPSNYIKIRGANQMGEVPPSYRCYKCHQTGHWIKNCPLIANQDPIDYKKSTGIPRSFMVVVEGPSVPGAMMTPTGEFAVPAIDHQAYKEGKKEKPPFQPEPELVVEKPEIPEDLLCTVCKDLLTDAIMIPCCGNSFCDDCIRTVLLESEDHECPDCKEKDVSPDSLIPNRFLRNAVNNFKNETGYHRTTPKIHLPVAAAEAVPSRVSVVATVSVSVSATQNTASTAHPQVAPVPLLAAHEPGGGGAAPLQSQFEPAVAADPSLAQTCDNTVSTIPVLGSTGVMVPHHHSVNVPVVLTATPIKDVPPASVGPVVPLMPAVAAPEAASSAEKPVVQVAAESAAPAVALSPAVALRVLDTKEAVASAKPAHGDGPVSHIEPVTSRVSVPTTLSSQVATQLVKVPVSASGTPSVQVTTALPQAQAPIKLPPLRVAEHTHLPPQPIYPPHSARLSVEDRPGTPTIDERNLEGGSTHLVAALPDTSVPPPNFNPPPPGETPQHFQIKTLEPMRSQRLGLSYRQEHSYGHRYNNDRYTSRETRAVEPLLPAPPGVTQYDANPTSYHRYNQYDVAPPGTGPDIPGIGSYDKMHYDRGYDRAPAHEARPSTTEYLTPPGVDMRSDYTGRECDVAMLSFRDKGAPPSRDRDPVVTSVLRDSRDVSSSGRDNNWSREGDHVASRDRDADRERNKDYYETDYRHTYESKSYSYNSPDRKKRHSTSPSRRGGSRDRYSGGDQHRHSRSDGRRKGSQRDTGKENRHTSQQPVEALDVSGDRDRDRDHNKDKEVQKRERVLVEVRKEPSVDKDKLKKEKEEKSRKDDDDKSKDKKSKDKKKKKKDVDGEKMKKKKRREKKDGNKKDATDSKTSSNEKVRTGGQSQGKAAKKEAAQAVAKAQASASASASAAADNTVTKTAQPITVVIGEKKTKPPAIQHSESVVDALYGDMEDTRIDDVLVASYGKVEPLADGETAKVDTSEGASDSKAVGDIKEETAEVTEVEEQKGDNSDIAKANVVLAPLPEPSKWELDDELGDEKMMEERLGVTEEVVDKSGNKVVTSEVLKRAENAIFQKAINAIRPIEPAKKPSVGERKVYATNEKEKKIPAEPNVIDTIDITRKVAEKEAREARKTANSIQITIPIAGHVERSVELSTMENATARKEKPKLDRSKFGPGGSLLTSNQWGEVPDGTSPHRVPVKERLGAKVDAEAEKRRDESEREEKSRRQRHRSRSNSREHKQHGSRKGLNLKSAVERKRTVSRSRSRSPYHRKIIADRKFLEPLKYVDPIVAAMELRYLEPTDRRYLDPAIERKYMEHGLRRDARYPEGDRRLIERDIRRPDKHYESERRRERSDSHERDWARSKTREERDHSRHKVKKRTKNRSESRSRKKSILDREVKRSKKKEKKHKKDKVKKHKAKADKEEKKDTENVKVDEKNELAVEEGKQDTTNQVPETAKEKPKQTSQVESEGTAENKEKSKKGNRKNPRLASDRKKSTLDEASFEPDYDLSSSGESETEEAAAAEGAEKKPETQSGDKAASPKKRDRSASTEVASASAGTEKKRQKVEKEKEGEKSNDPDPKKASKTTGGKASKKREKFSSTEEDSSDDSSDDSDSSSGSSSSSDEDSSDGSSVRRRRKKRSSRKHRRKKGKRSRRTETSSDSDSDSDSDDASSSESGGGRRRGRSTKKHKHHSKRASKKKKKSKHR